MTTLLAEVVVWAALTVPLPHDPGLSSLQVQRTANAVIVQAAFANGDFAAATPLDGAHDGQCDGIIDTAELAASRPWLAQWVPTSFVLTAAQRPLALCSSAAVVGENQDIELTLQFELDDAELTVAVLCLDQLSYGHRCYASAVDGQQVVTDALLHRAARTLVVPQSDRPAGGMQRALTFFIFGVEHILIGFDHLAFLLALLVTGITWRRALVTITAFTAAHSLTLIAAAVGVVRLPAMLVEGTIAALIVAVAVANLLQRRGAAPQRWSWAFGFGLVHGFGFAGVLADLGVGAGGSLVPLLAFNIGVEVGQLAFAAAVIPLAGCCRAAHAR